MVSEDAVKRLYTLLVCTAMIAVDALLIWCALHFVYNNEFRTQLYFKGHLFVMAMYVGVLLFLGRLYGGLLVGIRRAGEVMFSFVFTAITSGVFFYLVVMLLSYKFPNPLPLCGAVAGQIALSGMWIYLTAWLYQRHFKPYDVLLIYHGKSIQNFRDKLATRQDQFHIAESLNIKEGEERLWQAIDKHNTIMLWDIPSGYRNQIFKHCYEKSKRIYVMPKISDIILNGSSPVNLFDTPLLRTDGNPLQYEERVIKRAMDILLALVLIVITSPIMIIAALAIKLYDGGPALYSQVRCTLGEREFRIYKFRSMIVNAESKGVAVLAAESDPRITPIGRFIRACRIDELPQLFNVLKGDMSFVGPRPERPEFIEKYKRTMPEFSYRMKVRAGITGYAQLYGKYNTLPYDKLKFDLYYIEQYSLWLDIKMMILTLKILFTKDSTEGTHETVTAATEGETSDEDAKGFNNNTGA